MLLHVETKAFSYAIILVGRSAYYINNTNNIMMSRHAYDMYQRNDVYFGGNWAEETGTLSTLALGYGECGPVGTGEGGQSGFRAAQNNWS